MFAISLNFRKKKTLDYNWKFYLCCGMMVCACVWFFHLIHFDFIIIFAFVSITPSSNVTAISQPHFNGKYKIPYFYSVVNNDFWLPDEIYHFIFCCCCLFRVRGTLFISCGIKHQLSPREREKIWTKLTIKFIWIYSTKQQQQHRNQ